MRRTVGLREAQSMKQLHHRVTRHRAFLGLTLSLGLLLLGGCGKGKKATESVSDATMPKASTPALTDAGTPAVTAPSNPALAEDGTPVAPATISPVVIKDDAGLDAVCAAQTAPALEAAEPEPAADTLRSRVKSLGWAIGANRTKAGKGIADGGFWVGVREAGFAVDTPSGEGFFLNREVAIKRALLEAGGELSEYFEYFESNVEARKIPATETGDKTVSESVETSSHRMIQGGTVVAQAESWDSETKRYEVAIVYVWSKGLETAAMAALKGDAVKVEPPATGLALSEWLGRMDPSRTLGPRLFVDAKGLVHFIGVGARLAGQGAKGQMMAERMADASAMQFLAFSLKADVSTHAKAETKTRKGADGQDITISSYVSDTQGDIGPKWAKTISNVQVRGMSRVEATTAVHAISQATLQVSVYDLCN